MSMPADTPAAVITSPSSTYRSSGRTSMLGSSSRSRSSEPQWVVAGRPLSSPAARVHQRAGADAGQQPGVRPAGPDPAQVGLVDQLRAGAHPARLDQHVQRRRVRPGVLGLQHQPLGAPDQPAVRRDRRHRPAVVRPLLGPRGEHLPRPDRVQLLQPVEHQDPDRSHGPIQPSRRRTRCTHAHPRGAGAAAPAGAEGIGGARGAAAPRGCGNLAAWRAVRGAGGPATTSRPCCAGRSRSSTGRATTAPAWATSPASSASASPRSTTTSRARRRCCRRRWTRRWTG